MTKFQVQRKHSNIGLFVVISLAYIALLLLFGWQTWQFVNFLFPDDQLLMKLLTVFSFDVMALIWGCAHIFYSFAHPYAKNAVAWGWGVTNVLSLVATILYMVIQSMFRFHVTITTDVVNFGYGVTIAALVFNIGMIATFLYMEIATRFPNDDEFEYVDEPKKKPQQTSTPVQLAQTAQPPAQPAAKPTKDQEEAIRQHEREMIAFRAEQEAKRQKELEEAYAKGKKDAEAQSPLQQPQLDTKQASHEGTNGNK
jgi:hypothetical protein